MTTTCDYHNHSHAYTPCCCGHEYCEFYWKACPRCFGSGPQNRVEGLTKLVKGKFTKGPYNIVWGNPVEIYDGDQLLAAIPHHPRGEHTPNACLFNEAPQMFADLNIFCKLLDEFYPENIYAGENFDEFVAVHAALRHAKATLLRANGGISVGSMATERDETWWRARAEREEGHFIAAGAAPAQNADMVEDQAIIINSLLIRLNNRLVDMKPEWDDSLTGFNDAMDIVRDALKNPIVFTRRGMVPQP